MLSISSGRTAVAACSYLAEGKDRDGNAEDYYAKDEKDGINEQQGQWHGAAAQAFGFDGPVTAEDFKTLAGGFDKDGNSLVQNAGDPTRVAGHDLTFSAPKSMSIVWGLADDNHRSEIEKVHAQAVTKALDYLEEMALVSRTGHAGCIHQKAEMAAAIFQHGTSREGDPELHSHAFVFNACTREDGQTGAVEVKGCFDYKMAAGALYRAELASGLKELGYGIERDREFFKIAGVSREVEKEFSIRRKQIEAKLKETGQSGPVASANAALETRKAKERAEREALLADWKDRAKEHGLGLEVLAALRSPELQMQRENENRERSTTASNPSTMESPEQPQARVLQVESVLEYGTEYTALMRSQDIDRASFEVASWTGQAAPRDLADDAKAAAIPVQKTELDFDTKARNMRQQYTTENMLKTERQVIEQARSMAQGNTHSLSAQAVQNAAKTFENAHGFSLSVEQQKAVETLCSRDIAVLVGDAGTGKSTALEAVRTIYEAEGYKVVGMAPSGKAAAGLESGSGIQSGTIDKTLMQIESGTLKLDGKTVLILDEAGMIDCRKMGQIMDSAEASGAKVILSGDEKQLQPVGAGNTFAHIQPAIGAPARLTEIHRQKDNQDKSAVQAMSRGDAAAAMAHHIQRGQVTIARGDKSAINTTVDKYINAAKVVGPENTVMLASTNAQVTALNERAHAELCKSGAVSDLKEFKTLSEYDRGTHKTETVKIEIGEGSHVICVKSDKETGLKNGDTMTVNRTHADGKIDVTIDRTKETMTIQPEKMQLEHGYALTTHKAQGVTMDKVVVLGGTQTSRELAYVQASRARESTEWVFSKKDIERFEQKLQEPECQREQWNELSAGKKNGKRAINPRWSRQGNWRYFW